MSAPPSKDYYAVLQVSQDASPEKIREGYKSQALRWHPDRVPPDQREHATAQFKAVSEAYRVLRDPKLRHRYDSGGAYGARDEGLMDECEKLFREVFGEQVMSTLTTMATQYGPQIDSLAQAATKAAGELFEEILTQSMSQHKAEADAELDKAKASERQCHQMLLDERAVLAGYEAKAHRNASQHLHSTALSGCFFVLMLALGLRDGSGSGSVVIYGILGAIPLVWYIAGLLQNRSESQRILARHHRTVQAKQHQWELAKEQVAKIVRQMGDGSGDTTGLADKTVTLENVAKVGAHLCTQLVGNLLPQPTKPNGISTSNRWNTKSRQHTTQSTSTVSDGRGSLL